MKRFLYFILFSSIFISVCAVVFCMQTNLLLDVPLNSIGFYCFIFGSTLVQYNMHYVSKPASTVGSARVLWSARNRNVHYAMIAFGTILTVYGLFSFKWNYFIVLAVLGLITFLYSFPYLPVKGGKRLKDFGLVKITVLSLMWTIVSVWLPVAGEAYNVSAFTWLIIRRFVFMFILCLIFDVRDMHWDARDGIRTLPVIMGKKNAYLLTYILLIVFTIMIFEDPNLIEKAYLPLYFSALATTAITVYSWYKMSDITCLLGVDGMMLVQGVFVIISFSFL